MNINNIIIGDYWIVIGPTASGKSSYSIDLALKYDGEIINGDSMQLYKDLPIITAQPSAEERENIPHHLYGVLGYNEKVSVAWWVEKVTNLIKLIIDRGKKPIIVGGTGFYINSLINGISPMPLIEEGINLEVSKLKNTLLPEEFYEYVIKHDPLIIGRIHPNDQQRLSRALAVFMQSNQSITWWQGKAKIPINLQPMVIKINISTLQLHTNINNRAKKMLEIGAIKEVTKLNHDKIIDNDTPITRVIGYKEITKFLAGETNDQQLLDNLQLATRQYAKRQNTWLRNQSNYPHFNVVFSS